MNAAVYEMPEPQRLWVETDEFTAWVQSRTVDVRALMERAGVYRRKFDLERDCWKCPVRDLDEVIAYAHHDGVYDVTVDGEARRPSVDPWAVFA